MCSEASWGPVVDVSHGPWDGHWDGAPWGWPAAPYHPYGPSLTTTFHGHYPAAAPYYAPYAYAAHGPIAPRHDG